MSATQESIALRGEAYVQKLIQRLRSEGGFEVQERSVTDKGGSASTTEAASDSPSAYQVINGRAYNSLSEHYVMPADAEEHARLDIQHRAVSLMLESLYPFHELVRPPLDRNRSPKVLDIGTGSGRWVVDMATAYPRAAVTGIDLAPPALVSENEPLPPNAKFAVEDGNGNKSHYANQFDLVHSRFMETGVVDGEAFLYEMARMLQPGGVLVTGNGDVQLWTEGHKPIPWVQPGEPGFCRTQWMLGTAYKEIWKRGSTGMNSTLWWKEWLEANPNFSEVRTTDLFMPLGPWPKDLEEREEIASKLYREDIIHVFSGAWKRLLLDAGYPETDIAAWVEESIAELNELKVHAYVRYMFTAAVRSDTPFIERGTPKEVNLASRTFIPGIDLREL